MFAAFSAAMASEISGYLAENVPPNPQHAAASFSSTNSAPPTARMSLRGAADTPSSRRRWHESW
jgi:hypothetical protein